GNKNTGVEQAKKIAHSVNNTSIIIPEFKSLLSHPTDFNDLHQLEGLAAVKQQLFGAMTVLPQGYFYDKDALYYQNEDSDQPIYLSDELKITADVKDHQHQGYGLQLNWHDKYHQKHYWTMPAKLLAARSFEPIEQELRDGGLNLSDSSDAKRYLTRFLVQSKPHQCLTSVNKTGWYENTYVLADRIYNQPDMPYVFDQDASSSVSTYQNRGSLSDW
ncbi:DUF927 domain-containing protein, partial [Thiotrichales bacterium 19S9-12]|nr:DUF927 domain-containing protein [Thiotrichales bacterium 19S9-12]